MAKKETINKVMTKREWEALNKEVYDMKGNRLKVGDIVAYSVWSSKVSLGKVHHFAEKTVVFYDILEQHKWKMQRMPDRLIRVKYSPDKKKDTSK